jgi:hypothetical protein
MNAALFEGLRSRESDAEHTVPRCVARRNPSAGWKADGFFAFRALLSKARFPNGCSTLDRTRANVPEV